MYLFNDKKDKVQAVIVKTAKTTIAASSTKTWIFDSAALAELGIDNIKKYMIIGLDEKNYDSVSPEKFQINSLNLVPGPLIKFKAWSPAYYNELDIQYENALTDAVDVEIRVLLIKVE